MTSPPPGPNDAAPLPAAAAPAAVGGSRVAWTEVPQRVREWLEAELGAAVVSATSQPGGFSPGSADRLVLADDRRVFVKAVGLSVNPDSPAIHRRELAVAQALPSTPLVPGLLAGYDDGDWVALALEDVDGHTPEMPWSEPDLHRVAAALEELAGLLTPAPLTHVPGLAAEIEEDVTHWEDFVDDVPPDLDPWAVKRLPELASLARQGLAALAGDTLVHGDVRADNVLLTEAGVVVIDWPWASTGAPWFDTVTLALNAAVYGGHDPEALLARSPLLSAVAADSVTGVVSGLASYFAWQCRQPPGRGMPTVRAFQRAQGEVCLRWLRHRLDGSSLSGW